MKSRSQTPLEKQQFDDVLKRMLSMGGPPKVDEGT